MNHETDVHDSSNGVGLRIYVVCRRTHTLHILIGLSLAVELPSAPEAANMPQCMNRKLFMFPHDSLCFIWNLTAYSCWHHHRALLTIRYIIDSFPERDSAGFLLPDKLLRIARRRIAPAGMNSPKRSGSWCPFSDELRNRLWCLPISRLGKTT